MISTFAKFSLAAVFFTVLTAASWVFAAVEINLQKTLTTDGVPVDVAVSQDGNLTFVLTDDGNVLIYNQVGNLTDTIEIGPHIDQIEIGPRGERLFAASRQNKTVEIINLDFIHEINTLGSPSKGPLEAPVVIAVFSDFQ
jgi:DNA-binding beta-propeller fold protein YncE